MEVTFYEDPACSWCWAFEPVSTVLAFEFGSSLRLRRVMGGLRDRPAADVDFVVRQWRKAEEVSGMPFDCGVWRKRQLGTTFLACRAVKAASMIGDLHACRLLRRLREAQFVEQTCIDDLDSVFELASDVGIDVDQLKENIDSGRAEALFSLDRAEASRYGFGFPTMLMRDGHQEGPCLLQGAVPYSDLVQALLELGVDPACRRRFKATEEHWAAVFAIHPRLTLAELRLVTQFDKTRLESCLREAGIRKYGPFYELPPEKREKFTRGAQGASGRVAAAPQARPGAESG